jgi:hypothetical protein
MANGTASRIALWGLFLASITLGANVAAQMTPGQTTPRPVPTNHGGLENNAACQRIVSECRRLGFIQGQWRKDNGLWKDCVDPVVRGGTPTRDGKSINVPVSASDVQACREAAEHHR